MRYLILPVLLLLLSGCGDTPTLAPNDAASKPAIAAAAGGIPSSVTVEFGREGVGSPFDPPSGHDASGHSYDKVHPRTVVITAGGSVTFEIGVFHTVAIYQSGTEPGDINLGLLDDLTSPFFIPDFLINDPDQLIAASSLATALSFTPSSWTSPPGTFDAPGRYLVICRVVPHFVASGMYGWVIVK